MSGRGLGYCAGFDSPGYTKGYGGGMGRGFGFRGGRGRVAGFGRGFGFRHGMGQGNFDYTANPYMPTISREDEVKLLKSQAEELLRSHKDIEKRLKELEKESD
jgi:hypothetical protein